MLKEVKMQFRIHPNSMNAQLNLYLSLLSPSSSLFPPTLLNADPQTQFKIVNCNFDWCSINYFYDSQ